jgi:uncharacterized protein (TIGR03435 family)
MIRHSTVFFLAFLAQAQEVQISSSQIEGTQETSSPTFLAKKGSDLPTALAALYDTEPGRIVLPAPLNDRDKRYDLLVKTSGPVDRKELQRLMREGIEKHFRLSKSVEHREMDVYVMKAMPGRLHATNDQMGQSHVAISIGSGDEPPAEEELQRAMRTATLTEINVTGEMAQVRMILERGLHRAVIDETGLKGEYNLRTDGHAKSTEEFLQKLKDQTGLDVFPARRSLEILVFRLGVN